MTQYGPWKFLGVRPILALPRKQPAEGGSQMADEAGRLKEEKNRQKPCTHSRVVDYVLTKDGKRTGKLKCKECGAILPDERRGPQ